MTDVQNIFDESAFVKVDGSNAMTGALNMSNFTINNVPNPTSNLQVSNK